MSHFLQNINGDLLCAIDCETTGTRPGFHDIIQLAIIPLDFDLKPDPARLPFLIEMQPRYPQNVESEAMRINKLKLVDIMNKGIDSYRAQDLFLEWFEKQKLSFRKRLTPLGCNYPFDRGFLIDWLGPETYDLCFTPTFRDVQVVANYLNDRDGWKGEPFRLPKVSLGYLCSYLKIERMFKHDATDDARVTAEVYKRLVLDWS